MTRMLTVTKKLDREVREAFAGCSTGQYRSGRRDRTDYYETKGHAVNAFDAELQTYDLCLSRTQCTDYSGDEGRIYHDIVDEYGTVRGCAVLAWYRMPSGRYEFTGYIA